MSAHTQKVVEKLFSDAYETAVALVATDIQMNLPHGWRVVLAVGWGVSVFDASGKLVGNNGAPIPNRLQRALHTAEWLKEHVGLGNEQITEERVLL